MDQRKIPGCIAILAVSLLEESCLFKKEPRKATIIVPPSPQPPPPNPLPAPPTLPAQSTGATLKNAGAVAGQVPELPAPPDTPEKKKPKPTRRAPANANTQQAPVETVVEGSSVGEAAPAAPVLAPALQPILGPQEAAERNRRINAYLERARVSVYRAERAKPGAQAQDLIAQVRTFLQQAEEARKTDLARAENLAERAEVLSRGLNR